MDSENPFFSETCVESLPPSIYRCHYIRFIFQHLHVSLIHLTRKFEILRFFPRVDLNCQILSFKYLMFQVLMESEQLPEINISLPPKERRRDKHPKHNQETQTTIK